MNKILKDVVQWGLALVLSMLMLNGATFLFYHPVNELFRNGGSTPGLMYPYMWGLYGNEGYGIQTIDRNGYVNPDLPLEESYYIIVGASHTEGFHTGRNKRFSDLLNYRFGYVDSLKFYNIAHSDFFYDDIVKHFRGMCMEFPNMQGVVIEIGSTYYSVESLRDSTDQIGYTEEDSIESLTSSLSLKDECILKIKDYFPFIRVLAAQYETYKNFNKMSIPVGNNNINISLDDYKAALSATMDLIREEFSGSIVVVYHPMTVLDADGNLIIVSCETDPIFEEECFKHNISFINMADSFEEAYYEKNIAVYGFWNTTMMEGHINDYCHELIADKLYVYFSEEGLN